MHYAVTLAEAVRSISWSIWLYVFFWRIAFFFFFLNVRETKARVEIKDGGGVMADGEVSRGHGSHINL